MRPLPERLPASWRRRTGVRATQKSSQATGYIPVLQRTWGSWHVSIKRTPLRSETLAARYDRAAPVWKKRLNQLGVPSAYERLMRGLLADGVLRTLPGDAWVLDVGTGTGALAIALDAAYRAQRGGGRLMFSAVDRSPAMLRVARAEFDAARVDATLQHGDIVRLPYDDEVFDFAMAGHVVEHQPVPARAVQELVRVLRPGAPLLLLTTRQSFLGALVHLRWRVHRLGTPDLKTLLEHLGLEDIEIAPLPGAPWNRRLSLACTARKAEQHGRVAAVQPCAEASL